jgi:hypothetical protein
VGLDICYIVYLSLDSLLNGQQLVDGVLDTVLEAVVLDTKLLLRLGGVQGEDLAVQVLSRLAFSQTVLDLGEGLSDVVNDALIVEFLETETCKFLHH